MTKKDIIALADALSCPYITGRINSPRARLFYDDIIGAIADVCAASNPRFKRRRWLDYIDGKCGPDGGKR